MKKLFLLLMKYIPIIQMVGMLLNNILYYFDICRAFCYCLDFIIGNSILTTILMFIISYVFKYCNWYRIIIVTNFINLCYAAYDSIYGIPITDLKLLCLTYTISAIGIIIAVYINKKDKLNENKTKST